jgi:hypothetical protein
LETNLKNILSRKTLIVVYWLILSTNKEFFIVRNMFLNQRLILFATSSFSSSPLVDHTVKKYIIQSIQLVCSKEQSGKAGKKIFIDISIFFSRLFSTKNNIQFNGAFSLQK